MEHSCTSISRATCTLPLELSSSSISSIPPLGLASGSSRTSAMQSHKRKLKIVQTVPRPVHQRLQLSKVFYGDPFQKTFSDCPMWQTQCHAYFTDIKPDLLPHNGEQGLCLLGLDRYGLDFFQLQLSQDLFGEQIIGDRQNGVAQAGTQETEVFLNMTLCIEMNRW
ncbi:hypothetical protein DNTS_014539 [Danionella cerebrum]|uniref:Uncharacterized protein n=1 Tax=Danionella cerebrum TaxID=2873325 RepID=A0A553RLV0_9TELE|nr:hypothetical protein DNTS_014539 [Danionella translucida]